ncbi:MAG: hypothetical protein RXR01_02410 [Thermoproteus sp.]
MSCRIANIYPIQNNTIYSGSFFVYVYCQSPSYVRITPILNGIVVETGVTYFAPGGSTTAINVKMPDSLPGGALVLRLEDRSGNLLDEKQVQYAPVKMPSLDEIVTNMTFAWLLVSMVEKMVTTVSS